MSDQPISHLDDTGNFLVDGVMAILGVLTLDRSYEWIREDREVGG